MAGGASQWIGGLIHGLLAAAGSGSVLKRGNYNTTGNAMKAHRQ
jgi:hypothetical protein